MLRTTNLQILDRLERNLSGLSWGRTRPACTRFHGLQGTQDACGPRKRPHPTVFSAVNFLVAAMLHRVNSLNPWPVRLPQDLEVIGLKYGLSQSRAIDERLTVAPKN